MLRIKKKKLIIYQKNCYDFWIPWTNFKIPWQSIFKNEFGAVHQAGKILKLNHIYRIINMFQSVSHTRNLNQFERRKILSIWSVQGGRKITEWCNVFEYPSALQKLKTKCSDLCVMIGSFESTNIIKTKGQWLPLLIISIILTHLPNVY